VNREEQRQNDEQREAGSEMASQRFRRMGAKTKKGASWLMPLSLNGMNDQQGFLRLRESVTMVWYCLQPEQ
jgi:hypothetical protein